MVTSTNYIHIISEIVQKIAKLMLAFRLDENSPKIFTGYNEPPLLFELCTYSFCSHDISLLIIIVLFNNNMKRKITAYLIYLEIKQ